MLAGDWNWPVAARMVASTATITIVRTKVAKSALTFCRPTLAKIAVSAANTADNKAQNNQLEKKLTLIGPGPAISGRTPSTIRRGEEAAVPGALTEASDAVGLQPGLEQCHLPEIGIALWREVPIRLGQQALHVGPVEHLAFARRRRVEHVACVLEVRTTQPLERRDRKVAFRPVDDFIGH